MRAAVSERRRARSAEVVMKSTATTVAGYVDEQRADWQPTLRKMRSACRRELKGYTETMSYGMPSYARDGTIDVNFALQSQYLTVYVWNRHVFEAHHAALEGVNLGKACIRYRRPEQVDWNEFGSMLADLRDAPSETRYKGRAAP
jgi:uncharacterized protein YdhG (YjbR/CyaY superfamily)